MSDTTRPVPGRTPTDAERGRRRKALFQRAWIVTWSVLAVGLLVALPFVPDTWPDTARGMATGAPVGALAVSAAMGVSVWRARRGHDNATARALAGRDDERDQAIDLRSWRLTGFVAYVAMIVTAVVALLDGPVKMVSAVGMLVMIAVQLGSKVYYQRTM